MLSIRKSSAGAFHEPTISAKLGLTELWVPVHSFAGGLGLGSVRILAADFLVF